MFRLVASSRICGILTARWSCDSCWKFCDSPTAFTEPLLQRRHAYLLVLDAFLDRSSSPFTRLHVREKLFGCVPHIRAFWTFRPRSDAWNIQGLHACMQGHDFRWLRSNPRMHEIVAMLAVWSHVPNHEPVRSWERPASRANRFEAYRVL